MQRKIGLWALAVFVLALFSGQALGAGVEEFYSGKTVRFVVGFSAGGGFDTYTRLIARHIGKHIPGNPSTVVENMTGAGSLIAANYIYNRADPDGLTIGNWIGGLVMTQVLGRQGIKFDGRKFEWVGVPVVDNPICALTKASGITSVDKWFAAKQPVKLGATAPGSTTDDGPRILQAALNLPIQLVEGYGGTAKIRLAADSGEIDGGCWSWESIKVTWRAGIQSGSVLVVLQTVPKKHPELPNVPNAIDLAKTEEARELIKAGIHDQAAITRPYSLPPGTPMERVKALQKAFLDTMKDREFLAEAEKSKLDINPLSGDEVKEIATGYFKLKPATVAKLKDLLIPKK